MTSFSDVISKLYEIADKKGYWMLIDVDEVVAAYADDNLIQVILKNGLHVEAVRTRHGNWHINIYVKVHGSVSADVYVSQ